MDAASRSAPSATTALSDRGQRRPRRARSAGPHGADDDAPDLHRAPPRRCARRRRRPPRRARRRDHPLGADRVQRHTACASTPTSCPTCSPRPRGIDPVDEPDGTTPQRRCSSNSSARCIAATTSPRSRPSARAGGWRCRASRCGWRSRPACSMASSPATPPCSSPTGRCSRRPPVSVEADGDWWIPSSRTFYDAAPTRRPN